MEKKPNQDNSAMPSPDVLRSLLPKTVTEKRLAHILAVEKTAVEITKLLLPFYESGTLKLSDVQSAALLHDVTKCMSQPELVEKYGIELSEDDKASPETLHALTGAAYAKDVFHAPELICSAVRKHTVGGSTMSLLDLVLFIADYAEETRKHTSCKEARAFLFAGLEKAKSAKECEKHLRLTTAYICAMTAEYLLEEGKSLHRATADTFLCENGGSFDGIPGDYPLFCAYIERFVSE